jgi:hypothetical protein
MVQSAPQGDSRVVQEGWRCSTEWRRPGASDCFLRAGISYNKSSGMLEHLLTIVSPSAVHSGGRCSMKPFAMQCDVMPKQVASTPSSFQLSRRGGSSVVTCSLRGLILALDNRPPARLVSPYQPFRSPRTTFRSPLLATTINTTNTMRALESASE